MANYFTSDWHLNESRIFDFNPFYRPFKSIKEQNDCIINACNDMVGKYDTLVHVGDVAMDEDGVSLLDKIKCKKRILIVGNYDEDKLDLLSNYFDEVLQQTDMKINKTEYHINHYPINYHPLKMNIVGHIHGLWKVQRNMINVSCDAWHFKPISEQTIGFVENAITKFYDKNVFPFS